MLKTETCKTTPPQPVQSHLALTTVVPDGTHWKGPPSLLCHLLHAGEENDNTSAVLDGVLPKEYLIGSSCAGGTICTCNAALSFSNAWMYRKGPSTTAANIYLRSLLTENPSTAGGIFAASKFCSNEVTTLCPTHFSYIESSFPFLQSAVSANPSASCCCNTKVKPRLYGRGDF